MKRELEHLKSKFLKQHFQLLIIDLDGNILESCNSLVNLEGYKIQPASEVIPFLDNYFNVVLELPLDEELTLECVNLNFNEFQGIFDFKLRRTIFNNQEVISCLLEDKTHLYGYWLEIQQQRNESLLNAELIQTICHYKGEKCSDIGKYFLRQTYPRKYFTFKFRNQ